MKVFSKIIILFLFITSSFTASAQKTRLERDTIKLEQLTVLSNGQAETINWGKTTLEKALSNAKAENKHILIYFTAKWCGPCHKMEQEVFVNREVIRTVNDNYIALKIDVDAWGSKKWKEEFAIKGMPEFFILSANKQRLRHSLGAISTKEFLEFLNLEEAPSNLKILDTAHAKARYEKWKDRISFGTGAGISNLINSSYNNIFGYEVTLGYSIEKKRVLFNPAVSFTSIGSSASRLNYFKIPVQVALNFYSGSILGLPGGYRILTAPYYAKLLNHPSIISNSNDIGLDYGIGVYIGDTGSASLEFAVKGSQGFTDVLTQPGKQANQFFRASVIVSIRKN